MWCSWLMNLYLKRSKRLYFNNTDWTLHTDQAEWLWSGFVAGKNSAAGRSLPDRNTQAGALSSYFLFCLTKQKETDGRCFNLPQPSVTDRKLYATISAGFPFFSSSSFSSTLHALRIRMLFAMATISCTPPETDRESLSLKKHTFFSHSLSYPCLELFMTVRLRDIMI